MTGPTRRRRLVTKGFAATAGLGVIAALALYGFRTGPVPPPPIEPVTLSCDRPPTTFSGPLVIASGRDTSGARQQLVDRWNRDFPCVPAEIHEIKPSPGRAWDAAAERRAFEQMIRSGEAAVVNLDVAFLAEFAAPAPRGLGLLVPVPDALPLDGFLDAPLDSCKWQGKLYCLPFNSDVGMVVRRLPAPEPGSWLVEPPPGTRARTISLQLGLPNEAFVVNALENLLSINPDLLPMEVDPGSPFRVDPQAWNAAVEQLRRAIQAGRVVPAGDEAQSVAAFTGDAVDYARIWPSGAARISERIELHRLPVQGILGGQNLAVAAGPAADATRQAWAFELVEYLTSEASEKTLFTMGGFAPTRTAAYDVARGGAVTDPIALREAIARARTRPRVPAYFEVSNIIVTYLEPVLDSPTPRDIDPAFVPKLEAALKK